MNKLAFAILTGTMFISMLAFGLIMPLLPVYADTLGASGLELGLITASTSFANLLFLPIMGHLSDRFGRRLFLCAGLLVLTVASFGLVWADTTTQLILLRALQGLGVSMHLPVAQAYLGDLTPEGQEGRWMGYFNGAVFSGIGAGPLFGGVLHDVAGIGSAFALSGLCMFASFIATVVWLKEPARKESHHQPRPPMHRVLSSEVMRAMLVSQIATGVLNGMSMTFVPILASSTLALSATLIGVILASRTPISLLQTVSGRFADTHNRKVQIVTGMLCGALAMCLMPLAVGFWSLICTNAMLAFGNVLLQPAASAYVVEEGRTFGMGTTMAVFMMAMQLGSGLGPIVVGRVIDQTTIGSGFLISATLNAIGMLAFIWLMRRQPGRRPHPPATVI